MATSRPAGARELGIQAEAAIKSRLREDGVLFSCGSPASLSHIISSAVRFVQERSASGELDAAAYIDFGRCWFECPHMRELDQWHRPSFVFGRFQPDLVLLKINELGVATWTVIECKYTGSSEPVPVSCQTSEDVRPRSDRIISFITGRKFKQRFVNHTPVLWKLAESQEPRRLI